MSVKIKPDCTHSITKSRYVLIDDDPYSADAYYQWVDETEYTYDEGTYVGKFHCTQCGEVFYYTGQWRDFYEKGIPCAGSDLVYKYLKV